MAAKQDNSELFAESSRGAVSAVTFFGFILAAILFFGGMVVFSYGFGSSVAPDTAFAIFTGGLVASFLGVAIAFGIIPALEKK